MSTFIMLTRLSPHALKNPHTFELLGAEVTKHIQSECREARWISSFAVLGGADYVDIFSAPDSVTAMKVATIVRSFGHASTEVWPAIDWKDYKALLRELPPSIIQP